MKPLNYHLSEVTMKYKCGDILLLNNGKTVSVITVDEQNKEYSVVNTDNNNEILQIKERDVFQYLT